MNNEIGFVIQQRPYPPEWIFALDTPNFAPAPELWRWIKYIFLNPEHKLFNPDHAHLGAFYYPQIAVMWAKGGFKKQGRFVVGQTEKIMINAGGWKKERQEEQFYQWFNDLPEYLITIDATYAQQANDVDFCALIEHELYHIGVERDEDGEIIYSDMTGLPKHYLAGHDVEVFFGETKRWGADESVKRLLEIAKNAPFVSETNIAACCGNCVIG